MNQARIDYSPIVDRKPFFLPEGARVAVWVIPNIEHFHFDAPGTAITSSTAHFTPDVLNYSWRDYGPRVGVWRMMDIMHKYGVKGTVTLNSEVCEHYPQIMEAGMQLEWEWMGHGETNSRMLANLSEDEERTVIRRVRDTIERVTGKRPKGWLGPALTETFHTPDILAEEGFEYVGDWVNDDQPYPIKVRNNSLYSIPYSIEMNDITAFLTMHMTPEDFYQMLVDQFDVLYEDGASTGRVMSICLHPFLIGHPFRSKSLDKALKYITGHQDVWVTTGGEIIDHYKQQFQTEQANA
ncbi:polysaccharide deacetylase family protein [Alicyclobacillus fastidiosus]|uniref:Polysaccharide deacetylase family protein n=1 Tax=Alicyclobacillus fastidiosus TaxID=392011 RepID=A0ABV5AH09_9BACL|nr:polysaccharide deacetylase family protein [Alicyclobacillus fastidiosus]WEH08960.1 polysaccharide deacetylase family protein [Alicyclobacillus fastidiosus]